MSEDRAYAKDVADWCERELIAARTSGNLETRPFVQNAQLIINALRAYALAGAVTYGPSFADISTAAMRSGVQTIKFEDAPK